MALRHTQENRLITINSPLGEDVLLLANLQGQEGLSTLFEFQLELASEEHNILFEDIIGQNIAILMFDFEEKERYFHGMINSFSQSQGLLTPDTDIQLASYTATMVPWFWLLTMTSDSRVFQELSVPDIVEQIFGEKGMADYRLSLQGSYEPRVYCVQYRETDYNFICRILEEEGIFFYFEHLADKHVLVLADNSDEHAYYHEREIARFHSGEGSHDNEEVINNLERTREITLGKYTINDYNFTMPSTDLKVEVESRQSLGPGERELYDYPGEYENRSRGDHLANLRMQADEVRITTITGASDFVLFSPGSKFVLQEYFRSDMNDKEYVITEVNHVASQPIGISGDAAEQSYSNSFSCIPFEVVYRPPMNMPKPLIAGNQTAIVVGPAGEEIYTDEHGRVKVQFHWDREGAKDENSSLWIRVSQAWAGTGWGAMFIPRIGQEVIVDFLEGDPDRPIITGRVYHGTNTPPYSLPGDKNKSTIKSNSTIGGGGSNEICFDDTKGSEEIYIHGQKDMNSKIENHQTWHIGTNQTTTIGNNQKTTVNADHFREIKGNSTKTTIGNITKKTTGNVTDHTVGNVSKEINGSKNTHIAGDTSIWKLVNDTKYTAGLTDETFVGGKNTKSLAATNELFIGAVVKNTVAATMENYVGAKISATVAVDIQKSKALLLKEAPHEVTKTTAGITLKCGGSSITMTPGKITIKSSVIDIKGGNVRLFGNVANKDGLKSNDDSFFDKALHAKNFKSM